MESKNRQRGMEERGKYLSNIANNVQSGMSTCYNIMSNIYTQVKPRDSLDLLDHPHTKKNLVHIANVKAAFGGQLDEDFLYNSGAIKRGSKCFGCSHQSSLSWTDCHCCLWILQTHHTAISHRCLLKPPLVTPTLYLHSSKQNPETQLGQNQPKTVCIRTGKAAVKYKVHLQYDMYNRMHLMLQNESKSL